MYQHSIILFDGVCNLCNGAVQFVIKRDNKDRFLFASLQSGEGIEILKEYNLSSNKMNSFFLAEDGKVYDKSTAALKVLKNLSGLWRLFYIFIIVPKFIRDGVYSWVWFL